jgi:Rrf2 family nitric oxide-sensitive transcriptional repressor
MAIVSCLKPLDAPCAIRPCCVLKRALEKVRDAFIGVLDSYNLSDLVQPRGRLVNLLGISKIKALR